MGPSEAERMSDEEFISILDADAHLDSDEEAKNMRDRQRAAEKVEAESKKEAIVEEVKKSKTTEAEEKPNYPKRFKKVLFVVTDVAASYGKALNPHLGIAMLMSFLEKEGVDSEVIDLQLGYTTDDVVTKAKEIGADLIGVTMFSFDFDNTYKKIRYMREKLSDIPFILGGAHISTVKGEALEKTGADFGITRDGEIPLAQLCLGYPLEDIKSLIYRKNVGSADEEIVLNSTRKLNWKLDELPYPAFDKFELPKYIHSIDKRIPFESSRGCPYSCTYCDVKMSMGQAFRPRSPEHIVEELKHWHNKGYRYFEFVDDVFTMNLDRAKKVCQLIIDSKMEFRWNCANGIRADRIDEELLILMRKAGCEFVAYGLETGNPEMLKVIKKAITLEKATAAFHLTKKVGLKFAVNFIIGHQDETYERAMDSIKYAKSIPADYVNFSNMIPYPGTEIYQWLVKAEKEGRARFLMPKEEFLKNSTTKLGLPVFETREFRYHERVKALKMGRALAKKSHLKYRLGNVVGTVAYQVSRNNTLYNAIRRGVTGNKYGKHLYNVFRRQYAVGKDVK
ncbi:B12-binding domain-containing radical SAM protein [archaeon]|jgi:anaerobic magnesium-protoporphyrin IX monomethyl ester cyclase|nr:B12-binding domain-containing radical SAM protein [archaeon]MBT6762409.1 B12-binding domain-containing radical SAM protein [archaeon]